MVHVQFGQIGKAKQVMAGLFERLAATKTAQK
jgi:hypothetical protein